MSWVKQLAATLHPTGWKKWAAHQVLNSIDRRNMSLCRYEDAPAVPQWIFIQEGMWPTRLSGARSLAAVNASAARKYTKDVPSRDLGTKEADSGLPQMTTLGRLSSHVDLSRR